MLEESSRCPCGHHIGLHLKASGACFNEGCMCGWEMRDGKKYESHPMYDGKSIHSKELVDAPPVKTRPMMEYERLFPGLPCYYCGSGAESVDHLVPRSKGGSDAVSNKVPACRLCNGMKGNMNEVEFVAQMERILQTLRTKKVIQFPIQFGGEWLWRKIAT